MTQRSDEVNDASVSAIVYDHIEHVQEALIATFPEAKFHVEATDDPTIWHFAIYAENGRLFLPMEATQELNQMWVEHKISVITTIYPATAYKEHSHG